ncbi:PHP domain-containing protein [Prolixibacteraceae bacterium Z1-6]|uniref:PHP domain-containing protein n=1 Tax=Draconibacterium aestuarii TaxID=2998507 RepID=A0A9X3J5Q8_9BACT|nr:PHP domain-containing protein [Prolixibacteraceae bacterium Z1-6]
MQVRADLHIHTVLSPCADLEMTPANIVGKAKEANLQIIGITDHNSTKNAKLVKKLAEKEGIFVLTGAEVTTKEEVHCLVFFEHESQLDEFQEFLEENITKIPNPDGHFGYQPVVDAEENILELIPYYLTSALKKGISEVQKYVSQLNGIFIPAHVDRSLNGLFSHLGFIPKTLLFDAMGITGRTTEKHVRKHYSLEDRISLLYNSDAHFLDQIGTAFSIFSIEKICFNEIKKALNQQDNRFVEIL